MFRRDFLKGLFGTAATAVLSASAVGQAAELLEPSTTTIFDMGKNLKPKIVLPPYTVGFDKFGNPMQYTTVESFRNAFLTGEVDISRGFRLENPMAPGPISVNGEIAEESLEYWRDEHTQYEKMWQEKSGVYVDELDDYYGKKPQLFSSIGPKSYRTTNSNIGLFSLAPEAKVINEVAPVPTKAQMEKLEAFMAENRDSFDWHDPKVDEATEWAKKMRGGKTMTMADLDWEGCDA